MSDLDALEARLQASEHLRAEELRARLAHDSAIKAWGEYLSLCRAQNDAPISWGEFEEQHIAGLYLSSATDVSFNPFLAAKVDWAELFAEESQADFLLEPLLARGRAHAVFAAAKVGKSFILLPVAAALATGKPFLLKPATEPIDVLYCDYEQTTDDLRDRLTDFGYGPEELGHLHYCLLPAARPLDTPEGAQELLEAVDRTSAQFVVIDTMGRAVEGEENSADTVRAFYRHTGLALKARGVTWARLDHSGKDGTRGQRGSSAKNDDVDVVWEISKVEGGRALKATHTRVNWITKDVVLDITEQADGTWTIALPASSVGAWPEGTREAVKVLEELGVPVWVGGNEAVKRLREAGRGKGRQAVLAAVRFRKSAGYQAGTTFFVDTLPNKGPEKAEPREMPGRTTREPLEPVSTDNGETPPTPIGVGGSQSRAGGLFD